MLSPPLVSSLVVAGAPKASLKVPASFVHDGVVALHESEFELRDDHVLIVAGIADQGCALRAAREIGTVDQQLLSTRRVVVEERRGLVRARSTLSRSSAEFQSS